MGPYYDGLKDHVASVNQLHGKKLLSINYDTSAQSE